MLGQGAHQGAPWSMYMYAVLINELISILKSSDLCAKLGDLQTGIPTFADDMAIVSNDKQMLQAMLSKALKYSCKWRFNFIAKKSALYPSHTAVPRSGRIAQI